MQTGLKGCYRAVQFEEAVAMIILFPFRSCSQLDSNPEKAILLLIRTFVHLSATKLKEWSYILYFYAIVTDKNCMKTT